MMSFPDELTHVEKASRGMLYTPQCVHINCVICIFFFLLHFLTDTIKCVFSEVLTFLFSSTVSAETIQKNLEQMSRQIKSIEKDLETFPPPQNDNDQFVEKMSISFEFSY